MTRLWVEGESLSVLADSSGAPERIKWRQQNHAVQRVSRRWRVDVDWWRRRIWRDYFEVTTGSGMLVVLYHDLVSDRWYLERLYD